MGLTSEKARELGRKTSRKGIKNKSTQEIREAFQLLVSNNVPKLSVWLDDVAKKDPAKALAIVLKFGEFVLPKLQKTEVTGNLTIEQLMQMPEEDRKSRIIALGEMIKKVS